MIRLTNGTASCISTLNIICCKIFSIQLILFYITNEITFLTCAEFDDHPQMVARLIPFIEFNNIIVTDFVRQTNLHN